MKTRGKKNEKQEDNMKGKTTAPVPSLEKGEKMDDEILTSPALEVTSPPTKQARGGKTGTKNPDTVPAKKRKMISKKANHSSSSEDESSTSTKDSPTSSLEEERRKRRCTMVFDEDECICYPATGNNDPILASNAVISIDGTTSDGGYIFKFQNKDGQMFRMKLFTPDMGDTKALIKKIQAHVCSIWHPVALPQRFGRWRQKSSDWFIYA